MTIEQTVNIPENRRIYLDLPPELPMGMAKVIVSQNIDEYIILLIFDDETRKWYAKNEDIPIILEDDSLEKLINRIKIAAPEMLELNNMPRKEAKLSFKIESMAIV